jgi:hypothetical protein
MIHDNLCQGFSDPDPHQLWKKVQDACPTLTDWGVSLLRSGLDKFLGSVVLEPHYTCKDHRNLFSKFYSKKFQPHSADCARLHFFSSPGVGRGNLLRGDGALANDYIGFSVIRPVRQRCIGRTIIHPDKVGRGLENGYYLLKTSFKSSVYGRPFEVLGYPFMSQDTEVTVCAHAALWGVCRYLSERYPNYPERYPYDLVDGTTDTEGRLSPYRGMTYTDYSRLLLQFGTHPEIFSLSDSSGPGRKLVPEKFRDLCSYVESGFPVLTSYSGHVATLIGHTLDTNAVVPKSPDGLVDSSDFLKQFVAVDDNFFPYQLLGRANDPENYAARFRKGYSIDTLYTAVCPLPEKVYLPAGKARSQGLIFLNKLRAAFPGELGAGYSSEQLVTRLFVTTSTAYKRRKLHPPEPYHPDHFAAKIVELHLPHFLWVMEISPEVLYRQGICTGEIVMDSTANTLEDCLIFMRTGLKLILNDRLFECKGASSTATFPQFTHNLGEIL